MRYFGATFDHYLNLMIRLLPPGAFMTACASAGRPFRELLAGLSASAARIHNRLLDAFNEIDPRTAVSCLPTWERMCGLSPSTDSISVRQKSTAAHFTASGGNNPTRFICMAEKLGAEVLVSAPFYPFQIGEAACSRRLFHPSARHIWLIEGQVPAEQQANLENLFDMYAPAHIQCVYHTYF